MEMRSGVSSPGEAMRDSLRTIRRAIRGRVSSMSVDRLHVACALAVLSVFATAGCGTSREVRDEFADPQTQRLAQALLDDNGAKVTELIQKGANVNAVDTDGRSMLECAVWKEK